MSSHALTNHVEYPRTDKHRSIRLTVVRRPNHSVSSDNAGQDVLADEPPGSRALRESVEDSIDQSYRYTINIPAEPVRFHFVRQQLITGLRALTGVILGLGVGIFLATHITTTPPLHLNVAFVAAICCLLGLCLVPLAIRALTGKFKVDASGVHMTPGFVGFSVKWQELHQWSIEGIEFHVHTLKTTHPHIMPLHYLGAEERLQLHAVMRSCAPEKERRRSSPARDSGSSGADNGSSDSMQI